MRLYHMYRAFHRDGSIVDMSLPADVFWDRMKDDPAVRDTAWAVICQRFQTEFTKAYDGALPNVPVRPHDIEYLDPRPYALHRVRGLLGHVKFMMHMNLDSVDVVASVYDADAQARVRRTLRNRLGQSYAGLLKEHGDDWLDRLTVDPIMSPQRVYEVCSALR